MNEERHYLENNDPENNEPLLVLRYVPWKVLWKLFFPNSIAIISALIIITSFITKKPGHFIYILVFILAVFILAGGIWLTVDMLLMDEFSLYTDRVVKSYSLIGERIVYLDKANIIIARLGFTRTVYVFEKGNYLRRFMRRTFFDFSVGENRSMEQFMATCKRLGYRFRESGNSLAGIKMDEKTGGK